MRFKIENKIDSGLESLERLMFSEAYYEFLKKNHAAVDDIEVLEQTFGEDRIQRIVKYTPKPIIEKVGPKKIPRDALVFTEHSTYDRKRHTLEFENVPKSNLVRRRLTNKGTMTFIDQGGSTMRIVEGELTVRFPVLGVIAEKIIFGRAKKLLDEEVECFKKYVREAG